MRGSASPSTTQAAGSPLSAAAALADLISTLARPSAVVVKLSQAMGLAFAATSPAVGPAAKAAFGLAADAAFGLDPRAREDYGYSGDETLGPIGKAIIARYYGVAPARSYMLGCSNGGRHAMVAASRFPDRYDGFVAGDPGFELPRAAVQGAWDIQSFLPINRDIRKAFTPAETALISRKILDACDGLDGVRDGIVADIKACQKVFHLSDLTCANDKTEECLSAPQVQGLTRSFEGARNSKGEPLYSDWSYDAGISGSNWLFWKVASGVPAWNGNPLIATMGAASLAMIFTTPPSTPKGDPADLITYLARFNFDTDAPKIYATGVSGGIDYQESAWDFMTPPDAENPTLAGLKAAGGKLIVYHGQSDPVFSFNAIARWAEKLDANNGGNAGSFARLFAVPGMNHCSGGPATDRFDALGAIVDWAENGKAPDRIIASVRPDNKEVPADWSPSRTRPLCPWPTVARYVGPDVEKADSFVCK